MDGAYPVIYEITRPETYNRLTVAFRAILVIPQALLVGGGGGALGWFSFVNRNQGGRYFFEIFSSGVLMAVVGFLVFLAWFAIMFSGRFPLSMRDFCIKIWRWSQNVHAYAGLLADPYPPFGDGPYPLRLEVIPAEHYNRLTVFFRIFMLIPHYIVLALLGIAFFIVTVIAWFAILFTGQYPPSLYDFSVGVARWSARVGAYGLLFVDEYPPFSMEGNPGGTRMAGTF
jgi:hypothetical protein